MLLLLLSSFLLLVDLLDAAVSSFPRLHVNSTTAPAVEDCSLQLLGPLLLPSAAREPAVAAVARSPPSLLLAARSLLLSLQVRHWSELALVASTASAPSPLEPLRLRAQPRDSSCSAKLAAWLSHCLIQS
ncbi:uncharacterized protein J3R85_004048 [Psidium guajava]|nr:uncharacterized protein J3R85_004048 [Psidium guajava]